MSDGFVRHPFRAGVAGHLGSLELHMFSATGPPL